MQAPEGEEALTAGTCRFCICTDARGCEGGCSWVDAEHTLCSVCFAALEIAEKLLEVFGAVGPRARPPIALASLTWDSLTHEQQQLLVMACRRTVEGFRDTLRDELAEDAIAVATEFGVIGNWLEAHYPDQVTDETEALSSIVIRLLTPHVGSRLVLP